MIRTQTNLASFLILFLAACSGEKENFYPKPRGYVKVNLPAEHKYSLHSNACNFEMEIPDYARMIQKEQSDSVCYLDLELRAFNATVYLTYYKVNNNLAQLFDESRQLLIKHQIKANSINDTMIVMPDEKMFGVLYTLTGNVASNIQFVATDSANHFLRGAMHFYAVPNYDSLYPMIQFIEKDMLRMINTLRWTK